MLPHWRLQSSCKIRLTCCSILLRKSSCAFVGGPSPNPKVSSKSLLQNKTLNSHQQKKLMFLLPFIFNKSCKDSSCPKSCKLPSQTVGSGKSARLRRDTRKPRPTFPHQVAIAGAVPAVDSSFVFCIRKRSTQSAIPRSCRLQVASSNESNASSRDSSFIPSSPSRPPSGLGSPGRLLLATMYSCSCSWNSCLSFLFLSSCPLAPRCSGCSSCPCSFPKRSCSDPNGSCEHRSLSPSPPASHGGVLLGSMRLQPL